MEDVTKITLAGMASRFLSSLPVQKRQEHQSEVTKFIRWCGRDRGISKITGREVEQYAVGLDNSPTATRSSQFVRAFLSYAYKEGATSGNLSTSFRLKKSSSPIPDKPQHKQTETKLTQGGFQRLRSELDELISRRGGIADELRRAAADKDFRENAPLEAAREHQGQVESRIRQLEETLSSAVILEKDQVRIENAKISIGNSVSLKDLTDGKDLAYILVAPHEANLSEGKISVVSPVGKALLGKGQGEEVEVKVPAGTFRYRIEGINV